MLFNGTRADPSTACIYSAPAIVVTFPQLYLKGPALLIPCVHIFKPIAVYSRRDYSLKIVSMDPSPISFSGTMTVAISDAPTSIIYDGQAALPVAEDQPSCGGANVPPSCLLLAVYALLVYR